MLCATPLSVDSKIFLLAVTGLRMPVTGTIRNCANSLKNMLHDIHCVNYV